jgi:hypothetical protein
MKINRNVVPVVISVLRDVPMKRKAALNESKAGKE